MSHPPPQISWWQNRGSLHLHFACPPTKGEPTVARAGDGCAPALLTSPGALLTLEEPWLRDGDGRPTPSASPSPSTIATAAGSSGRRAGAAPARKHPQQRSPARGATGKL